MPQTLASPNRLVWAYASAARTLAFEAEDVDVSNQVQEKACAAVTMAVACVETYLNVFARLWLAQNPDFEHREQIELDLRQKKNLGRKLEEWPQLFFQKKADLGSGPGQKFKACLNRRNQLMHFISDAHDFAHENIVIKGLIDVSGYEELNAEGAAAAVDAAEGFIAYLLRLQGISEEQIPHALHHWLGKPPSAALYLPNYRS